MSFHKYISKATYLLTIVASIMMLSLSALGAPTTVRAANATYSCDAYGAGNYSNNQVCGSAIGAPNTGFAALLEPDKLPYIIGSLVLIVFGIAFLARSIRKRHA